jgi:SAM-dependent methyltransferase
MAPIPIATPNFRIGSADRQSEIVRKGIPLDLHLCRQCGMLQVIYIGNAHVQFLNYVYTTSLSLGLTDHFRRHCDEVLAAVKPKPSSLVVELGSNDGTLLRFYKSKGFRVQGIDPAATIAAHATKNGIPTIANFFGASVSADIRTEQGAASLVFANNVIANIDDLSGIVQGVRELLDEDGVFVFETQYGLDVILGNLLDTVYHEHLSYFYVKPLQRFFAKNGLELIDVVHIPTKGGSIRVFVQKAAGPRAVSENVGQFIAHENNVGAYGDEIYRRLSDRIRRARIQLHDILAKAKAAGRSVAGYGVSVGTTTLLAQFELGDKLDVLFDDDRNKDPILSGPGYDLKVAGPDEVLKFDPAVIIMFAWRYTDAILTKHQDWLHRGGVAVVPLPDVKLIKA